MRTKKGFTLIELLVVIAIIAILAAILFPVFARARQQARLSACINNLKQWGVALQSYMSDYGDRFPSAGAALHVPHYPRDGGSRTLYEALASYAGNSEGIKWCKAKGQGRGAPVGPNSNWSYWYFCRHNNMWVQRYNEGKADLCGYRMSEVDYPSKKPVITETSSQHFSERDGTGELFHYPILYADGHVKSVLIGFVTPTDVSELARVLYVGRDGSVSDR